MSLQCKSALAASSSHGDFEVLCQLAASCFTLSHLSLNLQKACRLAVQVCCKLKLLSGYRATLKNGFTLSESASWVENQLILPVAKAQLTAILVNKKVLEAKEERRIESQKTNLDKTSRVRNFNELDPGRIVDY
ncbi:hypothetical protein AVEN_111063-1 [Araneus ventricosus]|uniref:Uncharacterized protein n=1 Tax=Araneus ventricosus TaxID=182803 RepID=A0A4Y2DNY3_ARAVE|nr:hypothetical protein AVEN_111063-1 [Araneus ventricosus]